MNSILSWNKLCGCPQWCSMMLNFYHEIIKLLEKGTAVYWTFVCCSSILNLKKCVHVCMVNTWLLPLFRSPLYLPPSPLVWTVPTSCGWLVWFGLVWSVSHSFSKVWCTSLYFCCRPTILPALVEGRSSRESTAMFSMILIPWPWLSLYWSPLRCSMPWIGIVCVVTVNSRNWYYMLCIVILMHSVYICTIWIIIGSVHLPATSSVLIFSLKHSTFI
jgi:hypothetical protein